MITVVATPKAATPVLLLRHLGLRRVDEVVDAGGAPMGRYEVLTLGSAVPAEVSPGDAAPGPVLLVIDDPIEALLRTAVDEHDLERAVCGPEGIAGGAARLRRVCSEMVAWWEHPDVIALRSDDLITVAGCNATMARLAELIGSEVPDHDVGPVPPAPAAPHLPAALELAAWLGAGDLLDRLGFGLHRWPAALGAEEAMAMGVTPRTKAGIRLVLERARGGSCTDAEQEVLRRFTLRNASVGVPPREVSAPSVGFVHIRKAAGTSMDQLLRSFFLPSELLGDDLMRRSPDRWPAGATDAIRYAKCHATVGAVRRALPHAHLITMLRHPIDRLVAHHGHLQWDRVPPEIRAELDDDPDLRASIELASSLDLNAWIHRQRTHRDAYLPDHQLWALAGDESTFQRHGRGAPPDRADGEAMLQRAIEVLHHEVAFFGIVEEYDRSMRLFEATFGLPPGTTAGEVLNAAPEPAPALSVEAAAMAVQDHRLDLELYRAARDLFDQRCAAAGVDRAPRPAAPAATSPPGVLFTSLPKSGTHLVLAGFEAMGLVRAPDDLIRLVDRRHGAPAHPTDLVLSSARPPTGGPGSSILRAPGAMVADVLAWTTTGTWGHAHLWWSAELEQLVADAGLRIVLGVRDPRAVLLSHAEWIVDPDAAHPSRTALAGTSLAERVLHLLEPPPLLGQPGPSFATLYRAIAAWRRVPGVHVVRYEDLAGPSAGGSSTAQLAALAALAEHLGQPADAAATERIAAGLFGGTTTFRHGQIDRWRSALGVEHLRAVQEQLAPEMEAFDYQQA